MGARAARESPESDPGFRLPLLAALRVDTVGLPSALALRGPGPVWCSDRVSQPLASLQRGGG